MFVHLHSHSDHSLRESTCRVQDLVVRAAELGQPAIGLTDHGVLSGAVELEREASRHGIKPVYGLGAFLCEDRRLAAPRYHGTELNLLAADERGYRNLMRLSSAGFDKGLHAGRPSVDPALLTEHAAGLIALVGCLGSRLADLLLAEEVQEARAHADELSQIFGSERLYLELQPGVSTRQGKLNGQLAALSAQSGLPLVASAAVSYVRREDHGAYRALRALASGETLAGSPAGPDARYLQSAEEIEEAFALWPAAIRATAEIAERCDVRLPPFGTRPLPFPTPVGHSERTMLRELAEGGLARRYGDPPPAEALERMEAELAAIAEHGAEARFLFAWDALRDLRERGVIIGPGRGAETGSIVNYCLAVTDVDPLTHDLLFERFIRRRPPEFAFDLPVAARRSVVEHLTDRHGERSVVSPAILSRTSARSAIREAATALGAPSEVGAQIAALVPDPVMGRMRSIAECLEAGTGLEVACSENPQVRAIVALAGGLEGLVRTVGRHPSTVIIGRDPISDKVPLQALEDRGPGRPPEGNPVAQYPLSFLDSAGLLKLDFLSLLDLDRVELALVLIERSTGRRPDLRSLALDDVKAYELLSGGESDGVFAFTTERGPELLRAVQPQRFDDLAALIALDRPGGLEALAAFTRNSKAPETVEYLDERLCPVLEPTRGLLVYQEQQMQLAMSLGGFSGWEADEMRRALGKNQRDRVAAFAERFQAGASSRGMAPSVAREVWDMIKRAANYAFLRAHAVSYALIAYWMAWLKAHYPIEFLEARSRLR